MALFPSQRYHALCPGTSVMANGCFSDFVPHGLYHMAASASTSSSTQRFLQSRVPFTDHRDLRLPFTDHRDLRLLFTVHRVLRLHHSSQKPKPLSLSSSKAGAIAIERKDHHPRSSFAQTAAVRHLMGSVTATQGLRFAVVVVARFNEIITKPLLDGALTTFKNYSVQEEDIDVVWVPGCFEICVVAQRLGSSGRYHAVLCIGAVIRGDTTHYDAVANSAASGVLSAGLKSGVPCIFGVLTCDNMEQAINRAGGKSGNKGAEAALTAIEMASLFVHHLR